MESYSYSSEDKKIKHIKTDPIKASITKKGSLSQLLQSKNRWLVWGAVGGVLLLFYTGGTYYVLFAGKERKQTAPVVYPTPYSATATPPPTPTGVPTTAPAAVDTTGWETYTNNTYDIKFSYPPELTLSFNNTTAGQDPYFMKLAYTNASQSGNVTIDVQDISFIGQSDQQSRTIIQMNLLDFASEKRSLNFTYNDLNVPNRRVSSLTTMTFLGNPAYSFTVTGSYYDDRGYQTLDEEYTYLMTEHEEYKIVIAYPSADPLLKKVVDMIEFF